MAPLIELFVVVSMLGALVGTATGLVLLRRRISSPVIMPLSLIMFGSAEWAVTRSMSYLVDDRGLAIAFQYARFPGVALVTAAAFWYFLVLAGRGAAVGRRTALLLAIEPVALLVAVVTDPIHHLVYLDAAPLGSGVRGAVLGPLFWANTVYSYALLVVGMVIVSRTMVRAVAGHRAGIFVAVLGGSVPFVGSVASLAWPMPGGTLDLAPMFFLVTAAIWLWVERYGRPTRLVPIAARQVLSALGDAVMVLDPLGRVLDLNPAAVQALARTGSVSPGTLIGSRWDEVVVAELVAAYDGSPEQTIRVAGGSWFDVRVTPMCDEHGRPLGSVVVVRDVTEVERLRADLAELAVRDGLTGLHNRRHFEVALAAAVESSAVSGAPLSAVMMDIDHFKRVNDTYGHAAGDEVLVKVAHQLALGLRAGDVVARYGGEEFVLLLPGATADVAARRAQEMRDRCAQVAVRSAHVTVGITISAGVAQLPVGGTSESFLQTADRALYEAKAAGRDVVVVAPAAVGEPVS